MKVNRSGLYVGLLVLAAAVAGYMVSRSLARSAPVLLSGTALPVPRTVEPFALVDQDGKPFGNAELAGQPSLLFFGFTHCPDICPATLALLAQLKRDQDLASLRTVFVTVDPLRDDQVALQRYVAAFGAGLIGLRGEDAALEPLLRNLGVARALQPRVGSDYSVDHSAALFYINAQGAFSAVFTPPFDVDRLRTDLAALAASEH